MTTPATGTQVPVPGGTTDNVGGAHITVVSIGVMLFVTILLIELAGKSHTAAVAIGFLFLAIIALAGMTHYQSLQTVSKYPAIP